MSMREGRTPEVRVTRVGDEGLAGHLDEPRLARAVLADERVDLARLHGEANVLEGTNAWEGSHQVREFEKAHLRRVPSQAGPASSGGL
jgi:hypothetical protein